MDLTFHKEIFSLPEPSQLFSYTTLCNASAQNMRIFWINVQNVMENGFLCSKYTFLESESVLFALILVKITLALH